MSSDGTKKGCVADKGGKFHPLVGSDGEEPDSDTDNLVVDENPKRGKKTPTSASTLKPGSLKLKLSCK